MSPHTDPGALLKLADELREFTAMKYAGDCKCGKCQLVPRELVERIYHTLNAASQGREGGEAVASVLPDRLAVAMEIWHRFAPENVIEWEDEAHQAEYLFCADAILALPKMTAAGEPDRYKVDDPWCRPGAAQACTSPQRTALQKCSGALGTMPGNLKIAFTGEWAHLGTATISEILDEADAALSAPSASRGIEA